MKHTQKVCLYSTHLYKFYAQETRAKGSGITRWAPGARGLGTTEAASGQQWDRPNGGAPLQWMAVRGLED